jgi:predicted MFS family arabinose efflux permease
MVWTVSLVWAIVKIPDGVTSAVRYNLVVAVVGFVLFLVWETHTTQPMVPLRLFRQRNFSGACFSIVLLMFAFGGGMLVLTQYLQSVLDYTPTTAALALLPLVIVMIVIQPVASGLSAKTGQRPVLVIGLLVLAGAFGLFTVLDTRAPGWLVGAVLALFGIGAGLAQPAAMTVLTGAIPHESAGVGSALNDTMLQTGAAFGVASLGSLLASGYAHALPGTAPAAARGSLTEALTIAAHTNDSALSEAARHAFVHGMGSTFVVSAAVVVAGAVLAQLVVRDRRPELAAPAPAGSGSTIATAESCRTA